jgi:hypothetical protein
MEVETTVYPRHLAEQRTYENFSEPYGSCATAYGFAPKNVATCRTQGVTDFVEGVQREAKDNYLYFFA